MNIFILDTDVEKCAIYHNDKHVVKMITESAQMLCSAKLVSGEDAPYRLTHKNHPCSIWARTSRANWNWLKDLTEALNTEWQYRYDHVRDHKAWEKVKNLIAPNVPDVGVTPYVQAMPDERRCNDAVTAYRNLYMVEKRHLASWKKRSTPDWFK